MTKTRLLMRSALTAASATAAALTAHTAINLRFWRTAPHGAPAVPEAISVLVPARNEEATIAACLHHILRSLDDRDAPSVEVIVADDHSTDATRDIVEKVAADDSRVRLVDVDELPQGWGGKNYACDVLARAASGPVLVFLDADVRVAPGAIRRAVRLARDTGLSLISPYPRQVCGTLAERVVQPLLQWSFLTLLPLRLAEKSLRPSLSAANGQFIVVDAAAYRASGGHAATPAAVLDDVALLQTLKRAGFRGVVTDGTDLATCRMYDGWASVADGYGKSLWAAFGGPIGALGVSAFLTAVYVVPAVAALRGSRVGALGFFAGIAGRALVAHRTGGRVWPDVLAHPVSILAFDVLAARSVLLHRRGALTWRGRPIATHPHPKER